MTNKYFSGIGALLVSCNLMAQVDYIPIFDYNAISHPTVGKGGMVVSQREIASEVGADILRKGGNAVDAAVATALALAVVLPRAGNLGGGGFMLVYLSKEKKTVAIDYREMAPSAAHRDLFLDKKGNYDRKKAVFSLLSAGVPGTVAGLAYALEKYGSLSWQEVIEPALRLAEDGFEVTYDLAKILSDNKGRLSSNEAFAKAYYKANNNSYKAGEIIKLPDLAWSLNRLKQFGPNEFYSGEIAKRIVKEMKRNKGLMTLEDLATYKVVEREPVIGNYQNYKIISMPPSSSGGTLLIQMLNMLEPYALTQMGFGSSQ